MSLESWKTEFYPIKASEVPEEHAVEHSLQKWIGLRSENLRKHEVFIGYKEIVDTRNEFCIDGWSCPLCVHYVLVKDSCDECPLSVHLGAPCDSGDDSPYGHWVDTQDPEPMISALSKIHGEWS